MNNIYEASKYIAENVKDVISNATGHITETIKEAPEIDKRYLLEEEYNANAEIDIFDVKGTTHPNYIGLRWVDMLEKGIRMKSNLELLKQNPDYYTSTDNKLPTMSYSIINGDLYLTGDGNHRTAIAKVLFSKTGHRIFGKVSLTKYKINYELKEKVEYIKQLANEKGVNLSIKTHSVKVVRRDNEGWHKDIYEIHLYINGILTDEKNLNLLIDDLKRYNFFYKTFPFLLKSKVFKGG